MSQASQDKFLPCHIQKLTQFATMLCRFEEAKDALERALSSRDLYGAPLLVLANKQDVDSSRPTAEITQQLGLGKLDTRPCRVQPTCAYTGEGMREGLGWLVDEIRRSSRASLLRQRAIPA
jgi:ADP-ribosylation factor related protein 1